MSKDAGTLIWSADSSNDPAVVFGNPESEAPGSIYSTFIPSINKYAWQYLKPVDDTSYRCESRNIRIGGVAYTWNVGVTYQINWSSMIPDINSYSETYGDYVIFQWKSYGEGQQNYPFLMTVTDSTVRLDYVGTDGKWITIWSRETQSLEWTGYQITIYLSREETQGWLEFSCNGETQTFTNGETRWIGRTLDDEHNEPKWGCYDRDHPSRCLIQYVSDAKVYIVES